MAAEAFITDPKPIFSNIKTDDYYARTFVQDDSLLMVLVNRSNTDIRVFVPLTSGDGTVQIGGYTGIVSGTDAVLTGSDVLAWDLAGTDVGVFTITPTAPTDFSAFYASQLNPGAGEAQASSLAQPLDGEGELLKVGAFSGGDVGWTVSGGTDVLQRKAAIHILPRRRQALRSAAF